MLWAVHQLPRPWVCQYLPPVDSVTCLMYLVWVSLFETFDSLKSLLHCVWKIWSGFTLTLQKQLTFFMWISALLLMSGAVKANPIYVHSTHVALPILIWYICPCPLMEASPSLGVEIYLFDRCFMVYSKIIYSGRAQGRPFHLPLQLRENDTKLYVC